MSTQIKELSFKTSDTFDAENIWFADNIKHHIKWWTSDRGHFNEQLYQKVIISKYPHLQKKVTLKDYTLSEKISRFICNLFNY